MAKAKNILDDEPESVRLATPEEKAFAEKYESDRKAPALSDFGFAPIRANVHVAGHVGTIAVEIPGETKTEDRQRVAVQAAKDARGIAQFGSAPEVDFPE